MRNEGQVGRQNQGVELVSDPQPGPSKENIAQAHL